MVKEARAQRDWVTPSFPTALAAAPPSHVELVAAAQRAVDRLHRLAPTLSAAAPASIGQIIVIIIVCFGLAAGLLLQPEATLAVLHLVALTGFVVLACVRFAAACVPRPPQKPTKHSTDMPVWTVMVALYHESDVVAALIGALDRLDWPQSKLDVLLLVETDDAHTQAAIAALALKAPYRMIVVPHGEPRTKPRALNVGLAFARGAYVTVYDAEDRPAPSQLRAAWAALSDPNQPRCACVQAPLTIYNHAEGWLPAQFALEYAIHFHVLVPAFVKFGWAVPLGGTSNHFRAQVLRTLGAWDPYNVTEDADLGIRLARAGWKTGYIRPETLEEAPPRLGSWLRQRSRWLKGHAQTFGVHTRFPTTTLIDLGVWRCVGLVITMGATVVSALVHGPLALAALAAMALGALPREDALVLLLGVGSSWLAAGVAAWRIQRPSLFFAALTMPLYWPFQTIAAFRALHGLATRPFAWDKTAHGQAART